MGPFPTLTHWGSREAGRKYLIIKGFLLVKLVRAHMEDPIYALIFPYYSMTYETLDIRRYSEYNDVLE